MSDVTNVVVFTSYINYKVQEYFDKEHIPESEQGFLQVKDCCTGGSESLEGAVFCAAFNYIQTDRILKFIENAPWYGDDLSFVRVVICGQGWYVPVVFYFKGNEWVTDCPIPGYGLK